MTDKLQNIFPDMPSPPSAPKVPDNMLDVVESSLQPLWKNPKFVYTVAGLCVVLAIAGIGLACYYYDCDFCGMKMPWTNDGAKRKWWPWG